MKDYKVFVWCDVRTNDERDGFGDYQNNQLVWNGMTVYGSSEQDVRSNYEIAEDVVLEEVK